MKKIPAIAWKDVRSTVRNVPALVMMLVAPLALAALLGFAFGGGASFEIAATRVAVANGDTGSPGSPTAAGCMVAGLLESPDLSDVLRVRRVADAAAARKAVDDGDVAVAVVIPADFSRVVFGDDPDATSEVELYENPTSEIGGSIVEGVVGQVLADLNGARAAAAGAVALRSDRAGDPPAARVAAAAAETFSRGGGTASALRITQRAPRVGKTENEVSVTGAVLAGMMVFFMFFGASNVARTILTEDQDGTLPRMMTTPTPTGVILGGKFASTFLTVLAQLVVLLAGGAVLFGIDWGRPDVVAILSMATAAVAGGLALMIMGVVKTPGQAGAIGSGVYLVLALLGGNFTGPATSAGTYATVQGLTPNGPLLRGWNAAMRGRDLSGVAPDLIVPLAFAAAFFAVAVWRFRRRYA